MPRAKVQSPRSRVQGPRPGRECASSAIPQLLLKWFAANARDLPWRRTLDPYAIWVSEIMLQQTQVRTVIPYWERWLRELPDVAALATAPEQRVLKLWEGLGYYTRARNMQKAAQQIMRNHAGQFPCDFDAILALPGVGRYTAGAIASIAFNQPTSILDGNVIRVLTRLFAIAGNPRDKATNERLWQLADQLVQVASSIQHPASNIQHLVFAGSCSVLNQSLMELGATVCTPQNPQCAACPLRDHCVAHHTGRVAELPARPPRAAATRREFYTFVIEHDGEFLVTQRPSGGVNAGLWEFPNLEVTGRHPTPAATLKELLGLTAACAAFASLTHSITRYRITQRAFRTRVRRRPALTPASRWLPLDELHRLPFTSAHQRLLAQLAP